MYRSARPGAPEELLQLRDDGVRTARRRQIDHQHALRDRRGRRLAEVGLADLHRTQLELASPQVHPTFHEDEGVDLDETGDELVDEGNAMTWTPPARSSSRNTAYGSPFFVYLRAPPRRCRPRHEVAVTERSHLADLHARLGCQGVLDREQRVVGHELAEHLLLETQQRALVELGAPQHRFVDLARGPVAATEERELARRLRLALGGDRRRHLLLVLVQTASGIPEGVERAGQDQALEDLLREDPRIDLAAEIGEAVKAPFVRRDSMICVTAPVPTLRTPESP